MAAKPDFAQKLLRDLRLRKERMAAAQTSGCSAGAIVPASDAYGKSRQIFKGTRETVGPRAGCTYKRSSGSQKSLTSAERSSQLVPYGTSRHHEQTGDLSMALSYVFDNGGKLKRLDITSNSAVMGFLQQIGRRSMQSTTQFPTLTHLHIDEIAKGAQKLNQILRACSNGIYVDKGSIKVGEELFKGAMDLEKSLRMLVSLQEASDFTVGSKKKSSVKLLEHEDKEDDNNRRKNEQNRVERPVFSFDKAKNRKGGPQNGSHRRSVSCGPEFQPMYQSNEPKSEPEIGKVPNVIAKLMGLEEIPPKTSPKSVTKNEKISKDNISEVVPPRSAFRGTKSTELSTQHVESFSVRAVNHTRMESEKSTLSTLNKLAQERELGRDGVTRTGSFGRDKRLQASILKLGDSQSQIVQLKRSVLSQNETTVMEDNMQKKEPDVRNRSSRGANLNADETVKRVTSKLASNQQIPQMYEPQGKKLKLEERNKQIKGSEERLKNAKTHVQNIKNSKNFQTPKNQPKTGIRNSREGNRQHQGPAKHEDFVKSEVKKESLVDSRLDKNKPQTEKEIESDVKKGGITSNTEVKSIHTPAIPTEVKSIHTPAIPKLLGDVKPPKSGSARKIKEVMFKTTASRTIKKQTSRLQELKQKQLHRTRNSKTLDSESKNAGTNIQNVEPQTGMDAQEVANKNSLAGDQLQLQKEVDTSPPSDRSQPTNPELFGNQQVQPVLPGEVQELKAQETPSSQLPDELKDNKENSLPLQHEQPNPGKTDNQEPLTDDEIYLKQILITSHLFLNTAEALFKLNIPIGILNYASDHICQVKGNNLLIDCAYEILKRKGKRQELLFYPRVNKSLKSLKIRSFDDLVRQLHRDFEILKPRVSEYSGQCDDAEYLLRVLERDVYYKDPDVNCMWDFGWNSVAFGYVETDEVINDVERDVLDELLDEIVNEF